MPRNASSIPLRSGWRPEVSGNRRLALRVAAATAAVVVAIVIFGPPVARFLIVRAEPLRAEVAVVLSGSSVYDERVRHGISVFQAGRARSIVLTNDGLRGRWSRRRQTNLTSIERAKDAVFDAGIAHDRLVILTSRVDSTYDEAIAVRDFAQQNGVRTVLIITSPYHSRRALWVFRRVLEPEVRVGIDSPPPGSQSPLPSQWWLSKAGWHNVALEYPKLLYYRIKHG